MKTSISHLFEQAFREGALGEDDFLEKVYEKAGETKKNGISFPDLVKNICAFYAVDEEKLRGAGKERRVSQARAVLTLIARNKRVISLNELGIYLHRNKSVLSRLADRLQSQCAQSEAVRRELEKVQEGLF